jgi:YidC/Oxa1 family membrane protein insertase
MLDVHRCRLFAELQIGWFSLNVPSGLTLYWFTNNILTTGQQVYLKNTTKPKEIPVRSVPKRSHPPKTASSTLAHRCFKMLKIGLL